MDATGTGQADKLQPLEQQGLDSRRQVSVTGNSVKGAAVASRAGTQAAVAGASANAIQPPPTGPGIKMEGSSNTADGHSNLPDRLLDAAAQKALTACVTQAFKQHSVLNLQDIRWARAQASNCQPVLSNAW